MKTLELAASEEKKLFFLFEDTQEGNGSIAELNEAYGFDVFFIRDLHAKIYLSEREALICSMNLYNYSKENNYEIGYSIRNTLELKEISQDFIIGEMLKTGVANILRGRYYNEFSENKPSSENQFVSNSLTSAFCIRCQKQIPYDTQRPLCPKCFETWNEFQDPYYGERYCHKCGVEGYASYAKPLCRDCWTKS
jgi:hypothetical protein